MRDLCKNIFKEFFHQHLIRTRDDLEWTQEHMARALAMAPRSFVDLDHGKTSCSGLTLALYLSYCCKDPQEFLADFRKAYEKEVIVIE